jgi:predicted NAD/FAD-dependent oxidoreductase
MLEKRDGSTDVLIVGAGICGVSAAVELSRAGRRVMVVDKSRGVGGRMATRRIGGAVFDHGAQFITTRSERFTRNMKEWCEEGVVSEWSRGFSAGADGHSRWRGNPNMKALPQHLARGVDVVLEAPVSRISLEGSRWKTEFESGGSITSSAVVITSPVPQSLAMLDQGGFEAPVDLRARLEAIEYERCIAVLAVLDGPGGMQAPGGMAFAEGPLAWLADNQLKGISPVPCVTLHASHAFSLEHWDADRKAVGAMLLEAAAPWIRSGVKEFQTHGWLYSKPMRLHEDSCAVLHNEPPLLLAGDAFAGPKVEGAAVSGMAAAAFLIERLTI